MVSDDYYFESRQGDVIDLAISNELAYLNIKGIGKTERSAKVDRLQEILEQLRQGDYERISGIGSPMSNDNI